MAAIKIHYSIFEVIHALKDRIEQYNLQIQNEGGVSSPRVCVGPSVEENGEAAESFRFPEWIGHYLPFGLYICCPIAFGVRWIRWRRQRRW